MKLGSGIAGRPKGVLNGQLNISWKVLCCDLRQMAEFEVPMDNSYIKYPIGDSEYIKITKIDDSKYRLDYVYDGLELECQTLKNDNDLDKFVNNLLYDDYDFIIKGFIKQFKYSKNKKSEPEIESENDNED